MTSRHIGKADFILLFITLIWGSTFALIKDALNFISPSLFQGIRFAIAAALVGFIARKEIRRFDPLRLRQGIILGLMLAAGFALQTFGLRLTTASKSAFITGLLVVLTPAFQLAIERRAPTRGNVIGILLVTAGLWLLTSPQGSAFNAGDFMTLGCAVIFALYVVYLDIFTREAYAAEIVFYQVLVTAILGFALLPALETPLFVPRPVMIFALLYTAVFSSTVATFLQTKYQRESTPTRAAVIYSLEPVIAALFAAFLLHETLAPIAIAGAALILGGLLVSELLA